MRLHAMAAVLAALVLATGQVAAGTISLAWDAVTDPDLAGYRVLVGDVCGTYDSEHDAGLAVTFTVPVLDCLNQCLAVYAYDDLDQAGDPSVPLEGWARPLVVSADPAWVRVGRTELVYIYGSNFRPGSTVEVTGATVDAWTVLDCGTIEATVTVPSTASLGSHAVTVTHPDNVFGSAPVLTFRKKPGTPGNLRLQ